MPDLLAAARRELGRPIVMLIIAMTILRGIAAATWPLHHDEPYYWLWSRHLAWGYTDHPPMIAYLIFLTTRLGDGPLWIRLSALILGAATTYAIFLLGHELFDDRVGFLGAALYQAMPLTGVLAVPDSPLFLAWVILLRLAWQAIMRNRAVWSAVGLTLGLAMLSKLYVFFLVVGLAIFMRLYAPRWLARWPPYRALLIALTLFLPVILWNITHDWAMVRFILYERSVWTQAGRAAIGELLILQPVYTLALFPVLGWTLWAAWRRRGDRRFAYLFWTAFPSLAFPFASGMANIGPHAHLTLPGYLALYVALGALWNRAAAAALAVNGLILLYAFLAPILPVYHMAAGEVFGWREVSARIQQELAQLPQPVVVATDRYYVASQLSYFTRETIPVTILPTAAPHSIWPAAEAFAGVNAVAVIDARWSPRISWTVYAARVEEAAPLVYAFHDRWPARTFRIFRLYGLFPGRLLGAPGGASPRAGHPENPSAPWTTRH